MNEIRYIGQLLFLLIIQVFLLNQINFLGFANPMVYLLFFLIFPYQESNIPLLFLAFFSGIIIDAFSDTGGIYTAATLVLVQIRPMLIQLLFGKNFEYQSIELLQQSVYIRWTYVVLLILIYYITFYLLEIFNFHHIVFTLQRIIVSTFITSIICVICLYIFDTKKER